MELKRFKLKITKIVLVTIQILFHLSARCQEITDKSFVYPVNVSMASHYGTSSLRLVYCRIQSDVKILYSTFLKIP